MAVTIDGTTGVSLVQDGVITDANLPAGSVLQVVQTTFREGVSFTLNNTFSAMTQLNTNITPSSTSSKILIRLCSYVTSDANSTNPYPAFRFIKDSSPITLAIGTTTSNRKEATGAAGETGNSASGTVYLGSEFLDSPSTTSQITYGVEYSGHSNRTFNVGASGTNDGNSGSVTLTTFTLMEIAG
jgi:hypothetical protein